MADPITAGLAFIGGGSAATGAAYVAAAATAASGITSAQQSRAAGKIAEAQSNIDANAEGDSARKREIERKRLLARAISSQVAGAGAAGVRFEEGSPAAIARLDIEEANKDLEIERANAKQRQRGLRSQGRAARAAGNVRAATTLLDTATDVTGILLR